MKNSNNLNLKFLVLILLAFQFHITIVSSISAANLLKGKIESTPIFNSFITINQIKTNVPNQNKSVNQGFMINTNSKSFFLQKINLTTNLRQLNVKNEFDILNNKDKQLANTGNWENTIVNIHSNQEFKYEFDTSNTSKNTIGKLVINYSLPSVLFPVIQNQTSSFVYIRLLFDGKIIDTKQIEITATSGKTKSGDEERKIMSVNLKGIIYNVLPTVHKIDLEFASSLDLVIGARTYNWPQITLIGNYITSNKDSSFILPEKSLWIKKHNNQRLSKQIHRYVQLQMANAGDRWLNLVKIDCFNSIGENVTKGKKVSASTLWNQSHIPNWLTTDNNTNLFHGGSEKNDWVLIDLDKLQDVTKCVIRNRVDGYRHRILGAKLSLLGSDKKELDSLIIDSKGLEITVDFTKTRFVKLQMANGGDNWMNLSQITCYNLNGENITKGKKVTASSLYTNAQNSNSLTDGKTENRNYPEGFHSGNSKNDWVLIDLKTEQYISRCEIHNRRDCCQYRTIGSKISLLDNNMIVLDTRDIDSGENLIKINFLKSHFVIIQMPNRGDKWINISQLACFNNKDENVCLNKPVTTSKLYPNSLEKTLTDGRLLARDYPSIFHSGNSNNDWVKVDFLNSESIKSCVIYNRKDCCKERIKDGTISLLDYNNNTLTSRLITSSGDEIRINLS